MKPKDVDLRPFLEVSLSYESLETFKKSTDDGLSSRLDELSGALQGRLKD